MESFTDVVVRLLDQDPNPALTLDELLTRLESEGCRPPPGRDQLLRALRACPDRVRILSRPESSWPVQIGPEAWVLATARQDRETSSPRSIYDRLRASILALSEAVEPGSMRSWAECNAWIAEEREARDALRRAARREDPRVDGSVRSPTVN